MSLIEKPAVESAAGDVALAGDLPPLSDRLTVIRPSSRLPHLDFGELWQYRELALTFVWRDLKVRYKQTAIGVAWALLQPFVTMVVLTLIFGKFAKFPSQNLPYPIFLYSAQLPWTYFQSSFTSSSSSVSLNAPLVTKIYFPRVLLPLAAIIVPFVDFLLASTILAGMIQQANGSGIAGERLVRKRVHLDQGQPGGHGNSNQIRMNKPVLVEQTFLSVQAFCQFLAPTRMSVPPTIGVTRPLVPPHQTGA